MNFYSIKSIVAASDIAISLDVSLDDFLNESDKWTFGDTPHVLVKPFVFERAFYDWFSDQEEIVEKFKPLFNEILEAEAVIDVAQ
jgi:hypothetical protein